MSLADPLPITPFIQPVRGVVELPGSKSITNRALILAALADGTTKLTGALFSRDSRIMVTALQTLGFNVTTDESAHTIVVEGRGGQIPESSATIHVGNAGTAARFLTALVCLHPSGVYHFDGDEAMRKRPIGSLLDALTEQGAQTDAHSFPFTLKTAGLRGGEVSVDASESSQLLSALLMIAPLAKQSLNIRLIEDQVRWPFVSMTINLMKRFGNSTVKPAPENKGIIVTNSGAYKQQSGHYKIECDASAASYFIALPIVTDGFIKISDYHLVLPLQGDVQFAELFNAEGLISGLQNQKPTHTISRGPFRKGISANFNTFSDTFLTLAAIAPLLDGPTKITGIAHTRKQETDRVAGMARELIKLGQKVIETEDSLEIHPQPLIPDVVIETYEDHRFAMSFGILGCHDLHGDGRVWLSIKDPACCGKTFPNFFEVLESLRQSSVHS